MTPSPLAGKRAPENILIDPSKLEKGYFERKPDMEDSLQRVSFGTSGHRGTSGAGTFNEAHILAITQAICEFRQANHTDGPVFVGKDTHALSDAAQRTALEVLSGNGVETMVQIGNGYTPTPAVSHAILAWNHRRNEGKADGIVITPSHNPPEDGGFKYNSTDGGPADNSITCWIESRANDILRGDNQAVRRGPIDGPTIHQYDFIRPYVDDLQSVVDMEAIRGSGIRIGVDPMGGASLPYWQPIAERYGLKLEVVNPAVDPRFAFMTVDGDGRIRMDCSSPWAMASLLEIKDRFDVAWGNDPDADRHGIVTAAAGLLNPNHYLAVAIQYLLTHRPQWPPAAAVGKTLVSSSLIDKVVGKLNRSLWEVPVGFKWFVPGLFNGSCCFGGEESAGASFLRRDGTVWTTDKDGLIMGLLAAEITAVTGKDPGEHYTDLKKEFGEFFYTRVDTDCTPEQREGFKGLTPEAVTAPTLAGDEIRQKLTSAPGNNEKIGGLKVATDKGWFAARPSGTEFKYKIYAESSESRAQVDAIVAEARDIVTQSIMPAPAISNETHCSSVNGPPSGFNAS